MRFYFLVVFLLPTSFAIAEDIHIDYGKGFVSGTTHTIYNDLSQIDFQIIDINKFFIPEWIDEPGDFSDILQIKFNLTNNGLDHFVVYKDMFHINVVDPDIAFREFRRTNDDFIVDNYYPQYIEDFKIRFQDVLLPSDLIQCTLLNDSIRINQTKTVSVCFDVKQKWSNKPLNFDGPLLYYLVMMDNKFSNSCPNCISVLLNEYYQNPIIKEKLAPRIQASLGIPPEKISCKNELELIFKNVNSPACVTSKTAEILEKRGWMRMIS